MADKKFKVKVRDTENIIYEGEVERISSYNEVGPFDIYPMHANFISIIRQELIPLMDMKNPDHRREIVELQPKVYEIVAKYKGSITGEHNDGIIRTPYLSIMYGEKMVALFAEVKMLKSSGREIEVSSRNNSHNDGEEYEDKLVLRSHVRVFSILLPLIIFYYHIPNAKSPVAACTPNDSALFSHSSHFQTRTSILSFFCHFSPACTIAPHLSST
jgi:hypothetical protein